MNSRESKRIMATGICCSRVGKTNCGLDCNPIVEVLESGKIWDTDFKLKPKWLADTVNAGRWEREWNYEGNLDLGPEKLGR